MEQISLFFTIALINFILSGDNAVVIAMASRNLPVELQKKAIIWGSFGAIILRIILTSLITFILTIPYLHAIGGILLLYIAFQILNSNEDEKEIQNAKSLKEAIKIILIADLIMSLDNTLAIAALAEGNFILLVLGLATTIPIIIFCSNFILTMMRKFPIIVYLGAGILGWTGGEMLLKDEKLSILIQNYSPISFSLLSTLIPLLAAVSIIIYGKLSKSS